MRKVFMILAMTAVMFSSCTKDDGKGNGNGDGNSDATVELVAIDATSKTTWHYYNLEEKKIVGAGEIADDAKWAKRTDWDLAICRYKVRTNSGTSGVGQSGTYTCDEAIKFDALTNVPSGVTFVKDIEYTEEQMDETMLTESRSTAKVAFMEGMPPVWNKAPLYVIPSASGSEFYKVDFLSYKDASGTSGHVSFKFVSISK